jgi:transcription-repair coupling factor (superfamily II helicase)
VSAPPALLAKSPAQKLAPGKPLTLAGIADGAEGLVIADLARAIAAGDKAPAISIAVVCRDGPRMATLSRALGFFASDIEVLTASRRMPPWWRSA